MRQKPKQKEVRHDNRNNTHCRGKQPGRVKFWKKTSKLWWYILWWYSPSKAQKYWEKGRDASLMLATILITHGMCSTCSTQPNFLRIWLFKHPWLWCSKKIKGPPTWLKGWPPKPLAIRIWPDDTFLSTRLHASSLWDGYWGRAQ